MHARAITKAIVKYYSRGKKYRMDWARLAVSLFAATHLYPSTWVNISLLLQNTVLHLAKQDEYVTAVNKTTLARLREKG